MPPNVAAALMTLFFHFTPICRRRRAYDGLIFPRFRHFAADAATLSCYYYYATLPL